MNHFLSVAALLVLPSLGFAQTSDSTAVPEHPNSLRDGAWALQFEVGGRLLSVDSFAGGASLKRHLSPQSAIRFGVGLNALTENGTNLLSSGTEDNVDRNSYGFSIEATYQRYINPDGFLNLYWALGPQVNVSKDEFSRWGSGTEETSTETGWSVGALASLGVEWFFTRQFGLHGEYIARGFYSSREQDRVVKNTTGVVYVDEHREDKGVDTQLNNVRVGLSVYF